MPGRNYQNTLGLPYQYQGQEKDPETNLLNFELRQFDARIGRWQGPDPMGEFHSPYLAMGNNPVSVTDPTGGYTSDQFWNSTDAPQIGAYAGLNFGVNDTRDGAQINEVPVAHPNENPYFAMTPGERRKFMDPQGIVNHTAKMQAVGMIMDVVDKLGIKLELTAAHKGEYGIWHEGSTINGGASLDKTQVFTLETIGASVTWQMIVKEADLHRYRKYQEGSVGYFFHGVFDGVGEAVGGTLKFFASDAWKGETWKNFAKTAYAVSAPNSYEGIMFRAGIANKAANADIYDWGNFTGQVAVAAIGTKGMGAAKTALGTTKIPIYRVFGEGASMYGKSYSLINPKYVPFYRNFAGLPKVNSGQYLLKGSIQIKDIKLGRMFAAPLDGNTGGLPFELYQNFNQLTNPIVTPLKKAF